MGILSNVLEGSLLRNKNSLTVNQISLQLTILEDITATIVQECVSDLN
jgi:hypothetical protein